MTPNCYNCGKSQGGEYGEDLVQLVKCNFSGCMMPVCTGEDADECSGRRVCADCEKEFCEDHVKYCEICVEPYCKKCRRFNRDSSHQMCNTCYRIESRNLESDLEFSSSDDDDDDDEKTIEDTNLTDRRIKFYNRVHDIYIDESISCKDGDALLIKLCAEEWPVQPQTKRRRT